MSLPRSTVALLHDWPHASLGPICERERGFSLFERHSEGVLEGRFTGLWDLADPGAILAKALRSRLGPDTAKEEALAIAVGAPLIRGGQAPSPQASQGRPPQSAADASTRACLDLATAVRGFDVVLKGLDLYLAPGALALEGLSPFAASLVFDFAALAHAMATLARLRPKAIRTLYVQMDLTLRSLGHLRAVADGIRATDAQDPIGDYRALVWELALQRRLDPSHALALCDRPEEHFLLRVGTATAHRHREGDTLRKAILEQLAKDLALELGALPSGTAPWRDATGLVLTFPDGTPRVSTPFDQAMAKGCAHHDRLRTAYYDLWQKCMNMTANCLAVRLAIHDAARGWGLGTAMAIRLGTAYATDRFGLKLMDRQERAWVDGAFTDMAASALYVDELMRIYAYAPMAAAHGARLRPCDLRQAMLAAAGEDSSEPQGRTLPPATLQSERACRWS
jgi:hypothetical protein